MKTVVYVDGLNLCCGVLRGTMRCARCQREPSTSMYARIMPRMHRCQGSCSNGCRHAKGHVVWR